MRLTPILFILFILSGLWSGSIQAAAPVSVLVDPSTYVLIRPTSAQLAAANNLGGGGGGGYIFTASDFNESGSTVSIDFTNGQKATSLIPGYLTAADWITFNAKAPTASPTFTGTPIAPTAAADTNTTQIATTAFVIGQAYLKAATAATTYQGLDSDLTAIAALATTSFGRSLLTQSSAATTRAALDLEPGTDFLAYPTGTPSGSKFLRDDNSWVSIAGGGDALVANPLSQFAATTSAQLAGVLSDEAGSSGGFVRSGYLGTAATEASTAFQPADADLTTYANITPSANVQSLLGAADYSAMRTQLSLVPGTNVQAYDADLATYAGITPSANIQTFLGAANYAAMRTQLGLVISTDVQAYDTDLNLFGAITPSANTQSFLGAANYAAMRALLDLEAGTDFLAYPTGTPNGSKYLRDDNTWQTLPSGMGGNYTVTGNVVASSGNVTLASASNENIILDPGGTGETRIVGSGNTTGDHTIGGNINVTGSANFSTVNAVTMNVTTLTGNILRRIIANGTTMTINNTGNFTINPGDGVTIAGNATNNSMTINSTGGSGAETGDVKFILDSASVPSGWALTGVNGIPAYTGHDADYKPVIKMAGTVATPTFSPAAGAVASGTTITFSSATSGVTFMTTNNTTDPSRSVGTAGGTWTVSANQTLEVMAYKDGAYLIDSAVASAAYTVTAGGPAVVVDTEGGSGSGGNTFTLSAVNTTGASTLVYTKAWYGLTEPTITDSLGNTPTASAATSSNAGSWHVRQYVIHGGTVGSGHVFGLSGTEFYGCLSVVAFSGMASSPKDQDAQDDETAWTTLPSGSITPTQANTVSVTSAVYDNGSGTITVPTGYTLAANLAPVSGSSVGILVAWKVLTATTTINPEWTSSTSYLRGASTHVNYKY
jgi:hypothetical protein